MSHLLYGNDLLTGPLPQAPLGLSDLFPPL